MFDLRPWAISWLLLVSNCGFWLYCFNRLNAWGVPRKTTKRGEKLLVAICFLLPSLVFAIDHRPLLTWLLATGGWWPSSAPVFAVWGGLCLLAAVVLGPPWLESRRWLWPPEQLLSTQAKRIDVAAQLRPHGKRATGSRRAALFNRLPGNEITQLEVNHKQLRLPRPIVGIDEMRIAHISDLHFTGHISLDFHHYVVDRVLELQPQLIVITGDIIDYPRCLPWIEPLLGRLQAPLGCLYVLGNHDQRIADTAEITGRLEAAGLRDAGRGDLVLRLPSGGQIYVTGNERPWFRRHDPSRLHECWDPRAASSVRPAAAAEKTPVAEDVLRLGLSHSPDQLEWARQRQLDVLLAGHTHGGQVRVPGVGPLVAPSFYGSRFASGVFYLPPVLMHVSRGISGTHAVRWRCLPEVSLLTFRTPTCT